MNGRPISGRPDDEVTRAAPRRQTTSLHKLLSVDNFRGDAIPLHSRTTSPALPRDPVPPFTASLPHDLIRTSAGNTPLPDTVKIRSGWSEEMRDPVSIALRCQDAGARVLTLHPRTRAQMYTGNARWDEIAAVVAALDIPVLGNGDIKTAEDAVRMHEMTGCAGVMIARGSFGQPWIFDQTRDLLEGRPKRPDPSVEA